MSNEIRNKRLKNDYKEMVNIRGDVIQWEPVKGTPPLVEEYEMTINVRSIIGSGPDYRNQHKIRLILSDKYPFSKPALDMVSMPEVFHPNWWSSQNQRSRWCSGDGWNMTEGLGSFVLRMVRTLQFDPVVSNTSSPANGEANRWYLSKEQSGLFPCDKQALPDPTAKGISWNTSPAPVKKKLKFL